ncbi:RHS repeat-associated core domain-containing protein [Micromonospora maritima]|uniref:RHS repeat-associated core domain-containing protein n=1 Tax=Micromonospora maritima TaxID=986711 RepID=UPI001FE848BA|nr:RHS repeat-associated core domain-containing protein [Micromonospora maritima]
MQKRRAMSTTAVVTALASAWLVAPAAPASAAPAAPGGLTPVVSPRTGGTVKLFDTPRRAASRTAVAQGVAPTVPKGTGPVRNAAQVPFSISDRIQAKVNVGSGNLLITSTELTLPGVAANVTVGAAFNSLLLGTDLPQGAHGPGWRTRAGMDVRLVKADDGSVTYAAADGVVGKFTVLGSGYKTPVEFKAVLAKDGTGWKLTEHGGKRLYFDSAGLLTKTLDRNDNATTYTYASGKLSKVTSDRGNGSVRSAVPTYTGNQITKYRQTADDGAWREVSYQYDSANRLTTIQSATWRKTSFDYNSAGDLVKITAMDNSFHTFTYDGQHRVTSVTQVTNVPTMTGSTTRFAYPTSSQTLVADARQDLGQAVAAVPHSTYDLNSDKKVTKVTDPAGNERSTSYTPFGDVAGTVSPEGGTVTNTYGANGGESLTKSDSPTGASASAAYTGVASQTNPTANFQPSSSIDTQANSSTYTYNGTGNRTSTKDALAADAKVDYNTDGTVKSSTDPGNGTNATTYGYDANKQVIKLTPPTGNGLVAKTFSYDNFGRLKTVNDGCVTTYEYSLDDRVTKISHSGCAAAGDVVYEYGGSGNLIKRTDASGVTTYLYDTLNRLRERTTGAETLSYVPDAVGNLVKLTDGRGTTQYYYNTRNLLVRMDTAGGTRYNFLYDNNGNRTTTYFATDNTNSVWAMKTTTTYDKSDRPLRVTTKRFSSSPATVSDITYCYAKYVAGQGCSTAKTDDTGLRQWQKDESTGTVTQFSYDKGNRLTKATNVGGKTYEYAYDTNGNRTSVKVDASTTQSLTFNSANQITTTNNTYDGRGSQTKSSAPAVTTLGYNGLKQMTTAGTGSYTYAGADQVELTSGNGTTMVFGRQDQYGVPALQSYRNGSGTVYVERDGIGSLLGLRINNRDYAYVLDGQGSPIAVVSSDGTTVATYRYDPYGVVTSSDEYYLGQTNILRYAGGIYDPATKYTKFGQRWYNPAHGRFTQQDNLSFIGNPANGNRYAYAADNPIGNIDPTGQDSESFGFEICYVLCAGLAYEWDDEGNQGITGSIGTGAGASVSYQKGSGNVEDGGGVYGQCALGAISAGAEVDWEGESDYNGGVSSGGTGCSAGFQGTVAF